MSSFAVSNKPRSLQIKFKVKTQKDEEQDLIVGQVNNVNSILTNETDVLTTANQLKVKFGVTKTQMEENMLNDLGNGVSATSNVYNQLNDELFTEPYIIGVKTNLHQKLNTAIDKAIERLTEYHDTSKTAALALKDSKVATKAPKAVEESMHDYAVIISEAIDFGETYAGYDGLYKNTSFGIDLYAPELTPLVATVAPTTLTTETAVTYSVLGRCYLVNASHRLIDSSNYVIREPGLTKNQLVTNYQARYYTSDLTRFTADSSSSTLVIYESIAVPLGTPTLKNDPSGIINSSFPSWSIIYYSPLLNKYLLRDTTFSPNRLYVIYNNDTGDDLESYTSANPALLRLSQITATTSRTDQKSYYELNEFTDLIQILPGYQAGLITDQDRILYNSVNNLYFVLVVQADTSKTNDAFTTQVKLLPVRTRYGYLFKDNVYKQGITREELQRAGAMFYTENFSNFHNSSSIPSTADFSKRQYWVAKNRNYTFMTASAVQALASGIKTTYNKSQTIYYNAHLDVYTTLVSYSGDEVHAPLRNSTNGALIQGAGKTRDDLIAGNAFFVNNGTERIEINNGYQGYYGWSTMAHYPGMKLVFTGTNTITTAPSGFMMDTRTTTSITVKWNANASATGYKIFVAKKSENYPATPTDVLGAVTTYSATGLDEYTEYKFKIAGTNEVGDGPYTTDLNVYTLSSAAITNFAIGTSTTTSTQVMFDAIALTGVDTFKVYYGEMLDSNGDIEMPTIKTIYLSSNANADGTNTITEQDSKFKFVIPELIAGTTYHFQASIQLAYGETTKTAKLTKTLPMNLIATSVTGVTASARTTNSITFTWDIVPSATSYKVFLANVNESLDVENDTPTIVNTNSITMTKSKILFDLIEYTSYKFQIIATNELGDSLPLSNYFTVNTLSNTVTDAFSIGNVSTNSFTVSFGLANTYTIVPNLDHFRIYYSTQSGTQTNPNTQETETYLINDSFVDIYKSEHQNATPSNTVTVGEDGVISYTLTGLNSSETYYVQIGILFHGGQLTRSNVLEQTLNTVPVLPAYDPIPGLFKLSDTYNIYAWQYYYSSYYDAYAVRGVISPINYNSLSGIARVVASDFTLIKGSGKTRDELFNNYYRVNSDRGNTDPADDLENSAPNANWVEIGTYEQVSGLNNIYRNNYLKTNFNYPQNEAHIYYNPTIDVYVWGYMFPNSQPRPYTLYRFVERNTDKVIRANTGPPGTKNYNWFYNNAANYGSDDVKTDTDQPLDMSQWTLIHPL